MITLQSWLSNISDNSILNNNINNIIIISRNNINYNNNNNIISNRNISNINNKSNSPLHFVFKQGAKFSADFWINVSWHLDFNIS